MIRSFCTYSRVLSILETSKLCKDFKEGIITLYFHCAIRLQACFYRAWWSLRVHCTGIVYDPSRTEGSFLLESSRILHYTSIPCSPKQLASKKNPENIKKRCLIFLVVNSTKYRSKIRVQEAVILLRILNTWIGASSSAVASDSLVCRSGNILRRGSKYLSSR